MPPQPQRQLPWKVLFKNRAFRLIFGAQLVSSFGDVIHNLALMWLVYGTTGSALKTGGVATTLGIARLLCGLPAGALVDRWNRKLVMLISDIVRGVTVASLAVLLLITGQLPLWYIYAATFVMGVTGMVFGPARNAIMPDLVGPDLLLAANTAANMVGQIALVAYAALAGVLIGLLGPQWALAINSVTFFVSALFVLLAVIPDTRSPNQAPLSFTALGREIREALAFMHSRTLIVFVVSVVVLINFGSGLFAALTPMLVSRGLGQGPAIFGLISTAMVLGSIAGTITLELTARRANPTMLVVGGLSGAALSAVLLGFAHHVALVLGLFGLMSFALVFNQMPLYTALQRATPGPLRGRVFNTFGVLANVSTPVATALGAWMADRFGYSISYISGGVIIAVGAAMMVQRSQMLDILRPAPEERSHEMPQSLAPVRD